MEQVKPNEYVNVVNELESMGLNTPWESGSLFTQSKALRELPERLAQVTSQNHDFLRSKSWRITAPLRWMKRQIFRVFRTRFVRTSSDLIISGKALGTILQSLDLIAYSKNHGVFRWVLDQDRISRVGHVPRSLKGDFLAKARYHFVHFGLPAALQGETSYTMRFGFKGYQLDFDADLYLWSNPDAERAIRAGKFKSAFDHFCNVGLQEVVAGTRAMYRKDAYLGLTKVHWDARSESTSKLVIYAHHDSEELVDEHVVSSLRAYKNLGFDICLVTNIFNPQSLDTVRDLVTTCLAKNDAGRDFGSWAVASEYLGLDFLANLKTLILTNDSIYFPVIDPNPLFEKASSLSFDVFGMTDSVFDGWHVQSYFLMLNPEATRILIPKIQDKFAETPYMSRDGIIHTFEYGLTRWAMDAGLTVGAAFSVLDAHEAAQLDSALRPWRNELLFDLGNLNPTHHLFDLLVMRYQIPMLKRDLLLTNLNGLNLRNWEQLVDPTFHNVEIIKNHLARRMLATVERPRSVQTQTSQENAHPSLVSELSFREPNYSGRLVFFAHYDPEGAVDDHVLFTLNQFVENNCDVVFISSHVTEQDLAKLEKLCLKVILKTNSGRDIGSYKLASELLMKEIPKYKALVWANDAQYFPLRPLSEIFKTMEARSLDCWGIVDNFTETYHLMTFFVHFSKRVLDSEFTQWFIESYNGSSRKFDVIRTGEMRISRWMLHQNFRVGAFTESATLINLLKEQGIVANPNGFNMNIEYWRTALVQMKCPALKTELVLKNPLGDDLSDLIPIIKKYTEYPVELITNHVKRIKSLNASKNKPWQIDSID